MFYSCLRVIAMGMSRCSPALLRRMARCLSFLLWRIASGRRELAIAAIEKHLRRRREDATILARQSFEENCLSFLEIFHAGRFMARTSVRCVMTPETMAAFQEESAPIVVVTAHLGSWELMPGLAADLLPERHGMVVVRSRKNPSFDRIMAELRGVRGMQVIAHREASVVVLPRLRQKGVVALLADHNTHRKEAVFLPFLEDIAAVTMGPALLALRAKAAVFPVFLVRDGAGGHLLYIDKPLHTARMTGCLAEKINAITRFYTDAVAEVVKKHPEQWLWMHHRWKTREKN